MTQTTKIVLLTIAGVVMAGMLAIFGLVGLVVAASAVEPQTQVAQQQEQPQQGGGEQYPSQAKESLENLLGSDVTYGK
jgi:hypothetical protein